MARGLLLLFFLLAACTTSAPAAVPTPSVGVSPALSFPVTVTDFQGSRVTIATRPERIVSIGPSNTEFLFALGAGDRIVAVDDFSDEPGEAKAKDKVGGVRVNLEKVVSLRPDLVVSVKFSDGTLERLAAQSMAVLVVDPQGVGDVPETARLLGQAVGADGASLAREIVDGLGRVKQRGGELRKKRVFHELDASDPTKPFTVGPGSFVHDLIEMAGGINVAARASSPYPQLSAEEIVRADPEVIVLADAAYGVTVEQVVARPGWSAITAVRNRRLVPADASLMSRPGPRVVQAAETYLRIVAETP
jgi:iron complex transport system substrate-binding protein